MLSARRIRLVHPQSSPKFLKWFGHTYIGVPGVRGFFFAKEFGHSVEELLEVVYEQHQFDASVSFCLVLGLRFRICPALTS